MMESSENEDSARESTDSVTTAEEDSKANPQKSITKGSKSVTDPLNIISSILMSSAKKQAARSRTASEIFHPVFKTDESKGSLAGTVSAPISIKSSQRQSILRHEEDQVDLSTQSSHRSEKISRRFTSINLSQRSRHGSAKTIPIPEKSPSNYHQDRLASKEFSRQVQAKLSHQMNEEDLKKIASVASAPGIKSVIIDDDESIISGFDRMGRIDGSEDIDHIPNLDDFGYEKVKEVYHKVQDLVTKLEQEGVLLCSVREEFSSLWEGIEASHDNEIRLIQIDRQLSANLSAAMAKTRFLIKLAEDDPELAQKLGSKLEKAWNIVDVGEEQEKANQGKIDQLKQDIFDLNRNINAASRVEGRDQMKELVQIKHQLEKERDQANVEKSKYRSKLNIIFAKRQELFDQRTSLEEKSKLLDQEFLAQNDAVVRETGRKERLAQEIEESRLKVASKKVEINELEKSLKYTSTKLVETEKAVRDQRIVNDSAVRESEFSSNRIEKLRSDLDNQQRLVDRMTVDAYRRAQELKLKEGDVHNLKQELGRALRQRSLNMKRVVTLQQALGLLEIERESLKSKIAILERDLENAQKKLEENKKKVEELDKERSFVNRNLRRASAVTNEHANQVTTHSLAVRNLEQAVKNYSEEINEQKHQIIRLEKERDFYSHEATKLAQQVAFKLNDIKKLDMAIFQYRKKLGILETQLKKTQQIYDVALYDKSVFERTLRDTLTEILENNQKLHLLNNQVSSLKYQVNEKDDMIHREALRYDRILKETVFFSTESKRIQRMADDIKIQVEALEVERSTLGCAIAEVECELSKQTYYVNAAKSRCEVFQRKLMGQEIQLKEIWEKWKALHSTIRIGAYHYRNIMKEIQECRINVLVCKKSQSSNIKANTNFARLRHETSVLENCIAKEKCMMNALREQITHPINVHRWRVLEATDSEAYELVQKINLLTRRLVKRNTLLKDQTSQLNQKQAMYVEIRDCLQRSPGLETPEEVEYLKHLLVAKKQQLKTLSHELKASETQTAFYRDEVINLQDRMMKLKQQYFIKLRKDAIKKATNGPISTTINTRNKSNDSTLLQNNLSTETLISTNTNATTNDNNQSSMEEKINYNDNNVISSYVMINATNNNLNNNNYNSMKMETVQE